MADRFIEETGSSPGRSWVEIKVAAQPALSIPSLSLSAGINESFSLPGTTSSLITEIHETPISLNLVSRPSSWSGLSVSGPAGQCKGNCFVSCPSL